MLEQITNNYEKDDDQPTPKGMVRTEMGRLVKKADQDAWEKKSTAAMQAQFKSRGADSLKEKKVKNALKSMKKK
jgi:FKBP-type peptidyl-prolyl cis-trans isomerase (trigger factor)